MFEKMTIEQYTKILASKSPTPGGGSALATVAAIACSLVEMSANVTMTKITPSHEDYSTLLDNVQFFTRARIYLFKLSNDDAQAFRHIIDCMHLPCATSEEKTNKQSELQKAYHRAALVPLDVMRMCAECLKRAKNKVLPRLYKYVASDCKVGIDLFKNVVTDSTENVRANTCLIRDEQLASMLEKQSEDIVKELCGC